MGNTTKTPKRKIEIANRIKKNADRLYHIKWHIEDWECFSDCRIVDVRGVLFIIKDKSSIIKYKPVDKHGCLHRIQFTTKKPIKTGYYEFEQLTDEYIAFKPTVDND
jgi:hypothetical protein